MTYKTNYAEDCIHLKACRRICKFHNITNRGCRADYCTAYESQQEYYRKEDIEKVKYGACRDGQNGFSPGDLLITDYI